MADPSGAGASPAVTVKEAKHMKIPLFYGRADGGDEIKAEDLIDRIEALCKATGKGDDVKIQELYLALREAAVKWYKALEVIGVDIKNWSTVKKQFLYDYQFKISGSVAFKWEALRQKPSEKVVDFFARVNEEIEHFMEGVPHKDHIWLPSRRGSTFRRQSSLRERTQDGGPGRHGCQEKPTVGKGGCTD
jgi:hypothetical protein